MSVAPAQLAGCQHCQYRIESQEEAVRLLKNVIRQAHMRSVRGGGTVMEARLDVDTVLRLCIWESGCEDCEEYEQFGDSSEPESQGNPDG